MYSSYIRAVQYDLPERIDVNDIEDRMTKKTGIYSKHLAGPDEYASDLAYRAAEKLFLQNHINKAEIDFLLYCTQSPDYILPATSCILQDRLGLPITCGSLDFNLGCSGYVYGLSLAKGMVESGQARNVLLLNSDTYSKYIHPGDRNVKLLFGDAAAATLITRGNKPSTSIGPFVFGTDGQGAQHLMIPAGGLRNPITLNSEVEKADEQGNIRSDKNLYMNGQEILKFALQAVPEAINRLLNVEGTSINDYDFFIFHQANEYMLEMLRRELDIPKEKYSVQLSDVGNTVSATIPIALRREVEKRKIRDGDKVMLLGFGVGYSWTACSIIWNPNGGGQL